MAKRQKSTDNAPEDDILSIASPNSTRAQLWVSNLEDDIEETLHRHRALKLQDITWRLTNRENFRKFLIGLLISQNVAVFALVWVGLLTHTLQDLQLVFSVLVTATLAETASMIFFIIKWLFSEIPYDANANTKQLNKEGYE